MAKEKKGYDIVEESPTFFGKHPATPVRINQLQGQLGFKWTCHTGAGGRTGEASAMWKLGQGGRRGDKMQIICTVKLCTRELSGSSQKRRLNDD